MSLPHCRHTRRCLLPDTQDIICKTVLQDLSGRPFLGFDVDIPTERIGTFDTQLVEHFFCSLANTGPLPNCRQHNGVVVWKAALCCVCVLLCTHMCLHTALHGFSSLCLCCRRCHTAHPQAGGPQQPPHRGGHLQVLCACAAAGDRGRSAPPGHDCILEGCAHAAVTEGCSRALNAGLLVQQHADVVSISFDFVRK